MSPVLNHPSFVIELRVAVGLFKYPFMIVGPPITPHRGEIVRTREKTMNTESASTESVALAVSESRRTQPQLAPRTAILLVGQGVISVIIDETCLEVRRERACASYLPRLEGDVGHEHERGGRRFSQAI